MWEPRIYWVQKHQNGYPRVYLYVQDHCRSSIDNLRKKPYLCSVGVADWAERQLVPVGMERRRGRLGKRTGKKMKGGNLNEGDVWYGLREPFRGGGGGKVKWLAMM